MADKLQIYKKTLTQYLGERTIVSLTDPCKARRLMDEQWDSGFVRSLLSQGFWGFAKKSTEMAASSDFTPAFGLKFAYEKPEDWVNTYAISLDPFFQDPLLSYRDEAGFWYSNFESMFVAYISDDDNGYGGDLSKWPENFADFAAAEMAVNICTPLTEDPVKLKNAVTLRDKARVMAKSTDAMNQPVRFPPAGTWVRARRGGNARRSRGGITGEY